MKHTSALSATLSTQHAAGSVPSIGCKPPDVDQSYRVVCVTPCLCCLLHLLATKEQHCPRHTIRAISGGPSMQCPSMQCPSMQCPSMQCPSSVHQVSRCSIASCTLLEPRRATGRHPRVTPRACHGLTCWVLISASENYKASKIPAMLLCTLG
jgi:hypothetical protein